MGESPEAKDERRVLNQYLVSSKIKNKRERGEESVLYFFFF